MNKQKELTKYVKFIGEGECKRIDGNENKCMWEYFYFDLINQDVYSYRKTPVDFGERVVIAKVSNKNTGKKQQFTFHEVEVGAVYYPVGSKGDTIRVVNSHFKHSYIMVKMSKAESEKLFAMYRKQYNK